MGYAIHGGIDANGIAAGTQTASPRATVLFSNANGVTFGMSNSSVITASVAAGGGGGAAISAGAESQSTGTVIFSNSNGVSFGLNAGTLTAQHNGLTSQSNQNVTAGNGGFAFQTLSFSDANGVSFGTSAGSAITASHNALTSQSNQAFSADASSTFQTLTFQNSNGVSFSNNAGALRITHDLAFSSQTNLTGRIYVTAQSTGQSSSSTYDLRTLSIVPDGIISAGWSGGSFRISATQSNQAFSADASSTFQTLTFQNSNGFTFSNNAGAIRASYTVPVVSNAIQSVGSATGSGTNTSRFAADDHVHAGVFSVGVSNDAGNTSGDTRVGVGRFVFRGGNQITLSQITAAGLLDTIVISGAAPGAAAITQSIGISTQTAGGATAGTSGYATGDDILYHFVPGSNITMSQSLNGASATLSIYGPAAGGGATLSGSEPFNMHLAVVHAGANGTLYLHHLALPVAMQFDRVGVWLSHSNTTNSSGSATLSAHIGIYTRNASSLSLLSSTSATIAYTGSGTAGSYSQFGGVKCWAVPWTNTLTAGNYWIGRLTRSTTGGANMTFGGLAASQFASTWSGYFGSASAATNHSFLGNGVYSATLSTLPAAISLTQINANSSLFHRQPIYQFMTNVF